VIWFCIEKAYTRASTLLSWVALWALGFVRASVRARTGGCGSGSSLTLHEPVIPVSVYHHQGPKNPIDPAAFKSNIHLDQHSFLRHSDVESTKADRQHISPEVEVDV
jgi:hypothetical protein